MEMRQKEGVIGGLGRRWVSAGHGWDRLEEILKCDNGAAI